MVRSMTSFKVFDESLKFLGFSSFKKHFFFLFDKTPCISDVCKFIISICSLDGIILIDSKKEGGGGGRGGVFKLFDKKNH